MPRDITSAHSIACVGLEAITAVAEHGVEGALGRWNKRPPFLRPPWDANADKDARVAARKEAKKAKAEQQKLYKKKGEAKYKKGVRYGHRGVTDATKVAPRPH